MKTRFRNYRPVYWDIGSVTDLEQTGHQGQDIWVRNKSLDRRKQTTTKKILFCVSAPFIALKQDLLLGHMRVVGGRVRMLMRDWLLMHKLIIDPFSRPRNNSACLKHDLHIGGWKLLIHSIQVCARNLMLSFLMKLCLHCLGFVMQKRSKFVSPSLLNEFWQARWCLLLLYIPLMSSLRL